MTNVLPFPNQDRLLMKSELADHLRVSERWIELHQKNSGLPVERYGRSVRYRLSSIDAWRRERDAK